MAQLFGRGDHIERRIGTEQRHANGWPIALPSISRCKDWALVTASPLALTKMSWRRSPAFAAGPRYDLLDAHSSLLIESNGHRRREWGGVPATPN